MLDFSVKIILSVSHSGYLQKEEAFEKTAYSGQKKYAF